MMTNLLLKGLSLSLLASIPPLLGVMGSCITEATFWWYLPILELAWERKAYSRGAFWVFLPEAGNKESS